MKKIFLLLTVAITAGLQSCSVPEGPPGQQGQPGYNVEAEVFEVTTTFSQSNGFAKLVTLNPPILSSDMVLVYRLYGASGGSDLWRLLPQTVYVAQGNFDYNYDFTKNDINIFLDASFDLNTLALAWTQNQTFRVVIIPGYFSKTGKVIAKDYKSVVQEFKINEADFKKISLE